MVADRELHSRSVHTVMPTYKISDIDVDKMAEDIYNKLLKLFKDDDRV